jgi:diguanylate cyclase (GGDEF)-like protein
MTRPLRRLALALCTAAGMATAAVPSPWPPVLGESLEAFIDDPKAALAQERAEAARAQGERRFWRLLSVARLESTLELDDANAATLAEAATVLSGLEPVDPQAQRWLRAAQFRLQSVGATDASLLAPMAALRAELPAGPMALRCELLDIETWLLNALGSLDEAWRSAEALEACGIETGVSVYRAQAALAQGQIAAALDDGEASRQRAVAHFERATNAVAAGSGRYLRSLIGYAAGTSLADLRLLPQATVHLQRALAISRTLADEAGIIAAQIELAALALGRGRPRDALAPLDEAGALLERFDRGQSLRSLDLQTLRLRAMARLHHPELRAQLARTAALHQDGALPSTRRSLALALAEGYAAVDRHAEAYAAMKRASELEQQARKLGRDAQVLQLQMRYDTARRDAEIAALKHTEETTRLTLQAQAATQRGLWAALAALALGLVAAGMLGWRALKGRRELADLALRDALTGLPNRRAIEAYARAQLQQSQRLGLPFTLALVDLDRFKQVNDRHGHAMGDAVLQALARTAPTVLRAPDRFGRWGGEEFLLVLPGTRGDELGGAFARLLSAFAATEVPGLPVPHGITFSMGGTEASASRDFDALLGEADQRLYAAKAAGRATWR